MKKKYRSTALETAYKTAAGLYRCGIIDKGAMGAFETTCLFLIEEMTSQQIANLRNREGVTPGVFASHLNIPEGYVRDWESGKRRPTGTALKLLSIIQAKGLDVLT